ncbi:hypothetical protein C8J57DRAFT_690911 [Mycena rebaudengoi]|nr:hypothetical protein C8J57DRAFT_690911 [Mycena rebaudengoi]
MVAKLLLLAPMMASDIHCSRGCGSLDKGASLATQGDGLWPSDSCGTHAQESLRLLDRCPSWRSCPDYFASHQLGLGRQPSSVSIISH